MPGGRVDGIYKVQPYVEVGFVLINQPVFSL